MVFVLMETDRELARRRDPGEASERSFKQPVDFTLEPRPRVA
jgi:hypothetical protein